MATAKTNWRIAGDEIANCNCAWGCPCQFNALPTTGRCEALIAFQIRQGHFGDTRLDGGRFAQIVSWPGPIHEGNGTRQVIVDEGASPTQQAAMTALASGKEGGAYFEIFAAVCPNVIEPVVRPITLEVDRERRRGVIRIPEIAESRTEPIQNPVTGQEHRARIVLPNGFEYKEAEMGNTVFLRVKGGGPLTFQHENTYAQLNAFDWSNK